MTTELVTTDGEIVSLRESYGPEQMAAKLAEMRGTVEVTQQFFRDVMVRDLDYGVIPGTDKPALYKAGAEKLAEFYGYAPTVKAVDHQEGADGFYLCRVTIALVSKTTGTTVAEGVGEANTFESRYRWRWVYEDKLPRGFDVTGLQYREGTNRRGTWRQYRVQNDDMHSLWNTVLKMAKKRALVDAVLSATRSSGLFTQDAEEFDAWMDEDRPAASGGTVPEKAPIAEPGINGGDGDEFWDALSSLMAERKLPASRVATVLGGKFNADALRDYRERNPKATPESIVDEAAARDGGGK